MSISKVARLDHAKTPTKHSFGHTWTSQTSPSFFQSEPDTLTIFTLSITQSQMLRPSREILSS
uniref:Uncharacterized protein n=1 Tax=Physcomitrium patens TaxID=3218 RepID=A0A2K1KD66_PHYPA|nr:hypothetical protein PHYPA_010909 [Physcomitrium patens]